jgi:hypothetical protein
VQEAEKSMRKEFWPAGFNGTKIGSSDAGSRPWSLQPSVNSERYLKEKIEKRISILMRQGKEAGSSK